MRILLGAIPCLVFAVGIAAYRGAWLCYRRPERSGWWSRPRAGVGVLTFLATMSGPLMMWLQGDGRGGMERALLRFAFLIAIMWLYIPLLTYHAGQLLTRLLRHESQPPPEPDDPFERAVAAEERGDVRGAVERYGALLEDEPAHVRARTRLAGLLARTRHLSQATELIEQGLALEGISSAEKAEWKDLLAAWEGGELGERPPRDVRREDLAIHRISTAHIGAHEEAEREKPEDERPIEL